MSRYDSRSPPIPQIPLSEATPASANPLRDADERRVVSSFRDRREMAGAWERLQKAGFPMHQWSIVVRETAGITPTHRPRRGRRVWPQQPIMLTGRGAAPR